MSTEYVGFDSFPVSITIPTDDDEFDVASVDVPLEQLSDRTQWCKARIDSITIGTEFTDITFHGTTTFADGEIVGAVSILDLETGDAEITATGILNLEADTLSATAAHVAITAPVDLTIDSPNVVVHPGGVIELTGDLHVIGPTHLDGAFRAKAITLPDADASVDGTDAFEYILPNITTDRNLFFTGVAPRGWRVRFNAQLNTVGAARWMLGNGARVWAMANRSSNTVIIEFVSDGTQWIVDDWAEGGVAMRNGS